MYVGVMKNNYALISIGMFGLVVSIANAQSPNNDCNFPQAISGYVVTAYSTVGATTDGIAAPSCLFFSTSQIYNDIWYCWTAPSNDFVKIDLCGSTFDNKLAVYSDCSHCPDPALVIACNDDTCGSSATLTFRCFFLYLMLLLYFCLLINYAHTCLPVYLHILETIMIINITMVG